MKRVFSILLILGTISSIFGGYTPEQMDSAINTHISKNIDSADYWVDALLRSENVDSALILNAYIAKGIILKSQYFMMEALEYDYRALSLAERLEDSARLSVILNNLGSLFQINNDFHAAEKYLLKSLELEEKLNNPAQLSIRYYNIGELYLHFEKYNKASQFFLNSLILEEKAGDALGVFYANYGLANVYMGLGRWSDYNESVKVCDSNVHGFEREQGMLEVLKMKAYFKQGINDLALQKRAEILDKSYIQLYPELKLDFLENSHAILYHFGQTEVAYHALMEYNKALKESRNNRGAGSLGKLALEYEKESINRERLLSESKNQWLLVQGAVSMRLYIYLIICFFILSLSLYIYFK